MGEGKHSDEFDNFMYRVNEVSKIVSNLAVNDKEKNELGKMQADNFLKHAPDIETIHIDDETSVTTQTKFNRTVINKKALEVDDNPSEMSAEMFKKSVEEDASRRHKERLLRREQSDLLKRRGNNAFRQGDLEKALLCYNESIEQIRDSSLLYTNRALTYINLELYDKAIDDCLMALKVDEDSMKAWLYLAKCYVYKGLKHEADRAIKEVRARHGSDSMFIEEYYQEVTRNCVLKREIDDMNIEGSLAATSCIEESELQQSDDISKKSVKEKKKGRLFSRSSHRE